MGPPSTSIFIVILIYNQIGQVFHHAIIRLFFTSIFDSLFKIWIGLALA